MFVICLIIHQTSSYQPSEKYRRISLCYTGVTFYGEGLKPFLIPLHKLIFFFFLLHVDNFICPFAMRVINTPWIIHLFPTYIVNPRMAQSVWMLLLMSRWLCDILQSTVGGTLPCLTQEGWNIPLKFPMDIWILFPSSSSGLFTIFFFPLHIEKPLPTCWWFFVLSCFFFEGTVDVCTCRD